MVDVVISLSFVSISLEMEIMDLMVVLSLEENVAPRGLDTHIKDAIFVTLCISEGQKLDDKT